MTDSKPHLQLVSDSADITTPTDELGDARESLKQIVEGQSSLVQLDERIAAVEVECIEADMAASQCATRFDMQPADVVRLGTVLSRQRALREALAEYDAEPSTDDERENRLRQLRTGIEALSAWIEAPKIKDSKRTATLARVVLLMATLIIGGFAYVLDSWLVLILIIPIAGPISAMLQRGENTVWRRAGMQRRYEQSGLPVKFKWEEDAVAQRLTELEAELSEIEAREPKVQLPDEDLVEDERYAELTYESVDLELTLERMRTETGVETGTLDDETRETLIEAARLAGARQRLESVRNEREAVKRDVETRKDAIFALLSSNGLAPEGGRADVASLSEGLTKLEHQRR